MRVPSTTVTVTPYIYRDTAAATAVTTGASACASLARIMGENLAADAGAPRTLVEDVSGRRPFMRGIMVHSLLARGASFEDAYRTANNIRARLRGRVAVPRTELARLVDALLGDALEPRAITLPPPIWVCDDARRAPFSKGVLAQSLLAAAVAPDAAFRVAQQMEAALHASGTREIERDALRAAVFETLARERGARSAERYRVWRAFQSSDKPLILLLCGAAGVGKTALAQEVAHRFGIARVSSTDSIRQVMRIMLSRELAPTLHASSYEAHRVALGLEHSDDPVVDAFRAQAASVSVGVRAIIGRAVEENSSVILEGVSILPSLVDLRPWRDAAHLVFLTVATFDEAEFRRRFERRAADGERRPPHRYVKNLDAILQIQNHMLELAEQFEIPIVDNISFDDSVLSILRHVTGAIARERERRVEG